MSGWGPRVLDGSGGGGGGQIPGDTSTPDDILSIFQELAVPQAAGTFDIFSYTVPNNGSNYHLMLGEFGGTNVAEYFLYFGATIQGRDATWFNGSLTGRWDFRGPPGGLPIPGGTVIKITGSHVRPSSGNFWARITLLKVN